MRSSSRTTSFAPRLPRECLFVNLELCTLHLKDTTDLEQVLSFLLFGDGCAASIVSADPVGTALDSFHAVAGPGTRELITWNIREAALTWCCREGFPRRS